MCGSEGAVRSAATDGNQVWAHSLPSSESGGAGGGSEGSGESRGMKEGSGATVDGSREAGLLRVPYALARSVGGAPSVGLIILTTFGALLVRGARWSNCPLCEGVWGGEGRRREGRGGEGRGGGGEKGGEGGGEG